MNYADFYDAEAHDEEWDEFRALAVCDCGIEFSAACASRTDQEFANVLRASGCACGTVGVGTVADSLTATTRSTS